MSIRQHCALVTGATQGIGFAIAERLAVSGADVVLHGLEPVAQGIEMANTLAKKHGVRASYIQADLSDAAAASGLYEKASEAISPPDIIVNNAGVQFTCPVESFPEERWQSILSINLTAPFLIMRSAIPAMRQQGWGRIINIASVHGLVASVNKSAYLSAKHGLVGLSKGVALETATQGITVNCICPGWTDTAIIQPQIEARSALFGGDREAGIKDLLREKQPNQTLLHPNQIGDVAVFLCSSAASGITGVALPVDGGWTAQ